MAPIPKSAAIVSAIQASSFPDSEETLSSEINSTSIPPLLHEIQLAKEDLSKTISALSKDQADDVNGWIEQAKKAQAEIARCKEDYRYILQEHARIEALRSARNEARSKSTLLANEIDFNESLQKQISLISETSTTLNSIDANIRQGQLVGAAQSLPQLDDTIRSIPSEQSRLLLTQVQEGLTQDLRQQLDTKLDALCYAKREPDGVELAFLDHLNVSDGASPLSLNELLNSLDNIGALQDVQSQVSKRLESVLLPHIHKRAKLYLVDTVQHGATLRLSLSAQAPVPAEIIKIILQLLQFIQVHCPAKLQQAILPNLTSQIIPQLIVNWLDPAMPAELDQLKDVQGMQTVVEQMIIWLQETRLTQAADLQAWVNQIPRTWLAKRRANSLDTVRKALKLAHGSTRQVERAERQTVVVEDPAVGGEKADDDWMEHWDNDQYQASKDDNVPTGVEEDGSDAWGFDADEQEGEKQISQDRKPEAEDDEAEAWGWGDDEDKSVKQSPERKIPSKANGIPESKQQEQDITLTEEYTITDIPDYILEQIGKDITDLHTLQSSPQDYFKSTTSPPSGMQTLPILILAMYRAAAPDHYSSHTHLSRMNLYNDTLYLTERLFESAKGPSSTLQSDTDTLSKFARQIYTTELSTQRTVLHDLLDNAQGFTSCTVEPYLSQCETAISSTTDYLRSLHTQWSKILSPSHLHQSIGSLLSSIMSKMISEIEEMEDISEAQSQKLLSFMEQVSKLEDLFVAPTAATPHPSISEDEKPVSTIALHCPSYLRFQYLQQILDGSLADIKYLWTDAGLSIEFTTDEVVDLIKALFSESTHRRSAIGVIRNGR